MFAGICGGVGEYFEVDPVLIRLFWVVILMTTGVLPGILAYVVATFIVPERKIHDGGVH